MRSRTCARSPPTASTRSSASRASSTCPIPTRVLDELARLGGGGARLIVSLPNSRGFEEENEFHVTDYGYEEMRAAAERLGGALVVEQHLAEASVLLPGRPDAELELQRPAARGRARRGGVGQPLAAADGRRRRRRGGRPRAPEHRRDLQPERLHAPARAGQRGPAPPQRAARAPLARAPRRGGGLDRPAASRSAASGGGDGHLLGGRGAQVGADRRQQRLGIQERAARAGPRRATAPPPPSSTRCATRRAERGRRRTALVESDQAAAGRG